MDFRTSGSGKNEHFTFNMVAIARVFKDESSQILVMDKSRSILRLASSTCYCLLANEYYCGMRTELLMLLHKFFRRSPLA